MSSWELIVGADRRDDNPQARAWFGTNVTRFESFHWHGETFSIPPGAVRIMGNRNCENQGFVIDGNLGMQCHVEMTQDLIDSWCKSGADEIANASAALKKLDKCCAAQFRFSMPPNLIGSPRGSLSCRTFPP